MLWRDTISYVEGVQYCLGIPSVLWGTLSVLWWDTISSVRDIISIMKRYHQCIWEFSRVVGGTINTVEESTVFWRICNIIEGNHQHCGDKTQSTSGFPPQYWLPSTLLMVSLPCTVPNTLHCTDVPRSEYVAQCNLVRPSHLDFVGHIDQGFIHYIMLFYFIYLFHFIMFSLYYRECW